MSLTNYAIGARQAADAAKIEARPDQHVESLHSIRKAKIIGQSGQLYTVMLLNDSGTPVLDADGNPVTITRVGKFPPSGDESCCLLLFDAYGVPVILAAGGGSGASQNGYYQNENDLGFGGIVSD